MYLKALRIENYRGIREASLTFDDTSVLIGENDSGRSSVLEVLTLVLGPGPEGLAGLIQPHHFHRHAGIVAGPIRLTFHLAETVPGDWRPPARVATAWKSGSRSRREAWFEFSAELGEGGQSAAAPNWNLRTTMSGQRLLEADPELLAWVRRLSPVAWIRGGLTTIPAELDRKFEVRGSPRSDALLRLVGTHFRNLITGNAPDLAQEIEAGSAAARQCIEAHAGAVTGASLMGAMASEILGGAAAIGGGTEPAMEVAAQKIGIVLLLGAISQVGRLEAGPDSRPLLLVENPESNLHPMTVAAVWKMLQRLRFQKVITTHSGNLLANCPLGSIRRLVRTDGLVRQHQVIVRRFSREDLRRVSYHVRSRRASAMFARCWLLVEGESEFWIMPELARILGLDLAEEGIVCVEFAQCGLTPLIKLAEQLGISWHVLTDGDDAGQRYEDAAARCGGTSRVTRLEEPDIEHCFWRNGYREVIQRIAYPGSVPPQGSPRRQILRAIERSSKPFLALSLVDAVSRSGPKGVPPGLRTAIETCLSLVRQAPGMKPPGTPAARTVRGAL